MVFQTTFDNVDHLDHVTINKAENFWVTSHTTTTKSVTMSTLQLIQHKLIWTFLQRENQITDSTIIRSYHQTKSSTFIKLGNEAPKCLTTPYDLHKHEEYREWWHNNRPISPPPNFSSIIKRLNYGKAPEGNEKEIHMVLQRVSELPLPYKRTIGQLKSVRDLPYLAQAIANGQAIGVSDASVNSNDEGSQAYIIESTNEKYHITGSSPVDSGEDDMESTRSEMTGVLAILLLLQVISEEYSITSGDFTIYCDNKEAINIKQEHPFLLSYVRFCSNNYDLKQEIRHQLSTLYIKVSFDHVKGHKDDDKQFDYDTAPQYTKRNIDMDRQAKEFFISPSPKLRPHRCAPTYPNQTVCMKIHESAIVSNYLHHIKLHHLDPRMESRLNRKQFCSTTNKVKLTGEHLSEP